MITRTDHNRSYVEVAPGVLVFHHIEGHVSVSIPTSDRHSNDYHRVFFIGNTQVCTCPGYKYRDTCSHIARAVAYVAAGLGEGS